MLILVIINEMLRLNFCLQLALINGRICHKLPRFHLAEPILVKYLKELEHYQIYKNSFFIGML